MKHQHFTQPYHGPIHLAPPMAADDFFCLECGEEIWACECCSLGYAGDDPSDYRQKENAR